ncbi:unnamed protein product [Hydatigera taeniaeformis]|uniref:5'-AMP-activated protein kinase subunit gamma-1 n=1 Tax=Hydatigena taeniaeformis TaxID=6205 RepID=A0A0R3WI97_HYDTA|nr:unnamed protein product [Hydatigera taeniaeformis]
MSYPPSARDTPTKSRNRTSSMSTDRCAILFREANKSVDSPLPFSVESITNVNDAYRIFLKHHTSYDLIPLSAKLIVFDISLNVKKGFFALVYNGVRVAILWDSDCQEYVGLLTITDFIRILHKYYKSPEIPIVELEEHQIKTWREQMRDCAPPLIYITPERTLLAAVKMLLEHKVHRLPILDPQTGNPLHILTHKRLLKYLHFNMPKLPMPTFMMEQLQNLPIGTMQNVVCVGTDWPLHRVLTVFVENRVSALPVIDENGRLVDIYAKFDVINLAATRSYDNLEITVFDALQYRREQKFSGVATCKLSNTLKEIIDTIVDAGVHRLVVIDETHCVLGIVSLSDILRFLIQEHPMA